MAIPLLYHQWLDSMGAECPKVEIQNVGENSTQRGLFASADIFANERILFLPSRILLSEGGLQKQGSMILDKMQKPEKERVLSKEQQIVAMIEELGQLLTSRCDNMVQMTAKMVQYEWKGDDAVALYLIACRKLKQENGIGFPAMEEQQHLDDTDAVPLVVVAEEAVTSTSDPQEQPLAQTETEMVQDTSSSLMIGGSIMVDDALPVDEVGDEAGDEAEDELDEISSENEKAAFSSFLPHVVVLPKSFPTSPLYFTKEELSRIEGTNCYEYTVRMLSQMENDWMRLGAVLRAYLATDDNVVEHKMNEEESSCWDPDEDFESYKWALCTIYSRSTDFFISEKHRRVVAPLFDMMNHDFTSDVTHMMDPNGDISVFAGSDIMEGSEIFLNYGNFPNEKLLLVYGFVVSPNPFDAVQIYAPIPSTDPLYASKANVLMTKCGVESPNCAHSLRQNHSIPESLLWCLRLVGVQSQNDLAMLMESSSSVAASTNVVSRDNEYNALTALSQALHTMTRRLALNMISDANLKAASGLNPNVNNMTLESIKLRTVNEDNDDDQTKLTEKSDATTNPNILNSKILCQSEYLALQSALAELATRLELLQTLDSPPQSIDLLQVD